MTVSQLSLSDADKLRAILEAAIEERPAAEAVPARTPYDALPWHEKRLHTLLGGSSTEGTKISGLRTALGQRFPAHLATLNAIAKIVAQNGFGLDGAVVTEAGGYHLNFSYQGKSSLDVVVDPTHGAETGKNLLGDMWTLASVLASEAAGDVRSVTLDPGTGHVVYTLGEGKKITVGEGHHDLVAFQAASMASVALDGENGFDGDVIVDRNGDLMVVIPVNGEDGSYSARQLASVGSVKDLNNGGALTASTIRAYFSTHCRHSDTFHTSSSKGNG